MTNSEKKLDIIRLIIYLVLSFGLAWIIFIWSASIGIKWDGDNRYMESFVGLGMLVPVLSHVLTRFFTKEGFKVVGQDSMMLGINLREKRWKYYLMAILLPWLYMEASHAIILLIYPVLYDPQYYKTLELDSRLVYVYPIIAIINASILSFAAFGEEGGWRGYMMPKLIKLMGVKKAVFVGGIIWGLWHAPLTCAGHNFGTDYPGFPYVGILLMCVDCVCLGIILTYITIKSNSIWPAALMHAVNNGSPSILALMTNTDRAKELGVNHLVGYICLMVPIVIIGGICFVAMTKKKDEIE